MMKRKIALSLVAVAALAFACAAAQGQGQGQVSDIFEDADLALGERLLAENRCAQCHARDFGGSDGSDIYRPLGRINTAGRLRGMVEQCNTELGLALFPEEVNAIAAVLDRDHYRFGRSQATPAERR